MEITLNPHARLLVEIPVERYRILSSVGRNPQAGDIVVLDQGFTSEYGLPMVLVYFPAIGNSCLYQAEVYESELE
jgi:hypothetical protein